MKSYFCNFILKQKRHSEVGQVTNYGRVERYQATLRGVRIGTRGHGHDVAL